MARASNTALRRQQILDALIALLSRSGYPGATMAALAKATGLAQGLLHYHFAGKSEMIVAAIEELEARLLSPALDRARTAGSGRARWSAFVDALIEAPRRDASAVAAWVAIGSAGTDDADLRNSREAAIGRWRDAIGAELAAADAPGDLDATAMALVAFIEGSWRISTEVPAFASHAMFDLARDAARRLVPLRSSVEPTTTAARLRAMSPVALSPEAWTALFEAYASPGRHYHTLDHVLEVAQHWQTVAEGPGWRDARSTWLAVLFHDAVMAIGASDNEERSAELLLAYVPDAHRAAALIRLTAAHGTHAAEELDEDAKLFLDCDTAILGAPPDRFDAYERGIAAEYGTIYAPDLYVRGRRAFLDKLLDSPRIFLSDYWRDRLETSARRNLVKPVSRPAGR